MPDVSRLPALDPAVPHPARMHDYFLGGSHNFAADRIAAQEVACAAPWTVAAVRANRLFLRRAVRFCLEQRGIDQFLDLGSGIPTVGHVHETARTTDPRALVAYVDDEPVAVASAAALLQGDPLTTITGADLRDVDAVLAAPGVRDLLDLSRPVALLTVAVLHYLPDADAPADVVARYRARLAPGSAHVLSHATADHDPDLIADVTGFYRSTASPVTVRTRDAVAALFGDAELVEPGLVDATEWRPEDAVGPQHRGLWSGVGLIR